MANKFCGLARFDTADQNRVGHTRQNLSSTTKQVIMKTQNRIFRTLLLVLLTISLTSCTKDETPPPPEQIVDTDKDGIADTVDNCPNEAGPASNNGCPVNEIGEIVETEGILDEDLETYQGAIGIVVDARPVAKKGYTPKSAAITVNATSGDYSETVELDMYSFMGQISLEMADLNEDALKELEDGVEVAVELFGVSGATIWSESLSKLSFQSNPLPVAVKANDLEDKNTDVILNPDTPYYMQIVNEQGVPQPIALRNRRTSNVFNGVFNTFEVDFTGGEEEEEALAQFYFELENSEELPNRYRIKQKYTGTYLRSRTITAEDGAVYEVIQSGFGENTFTGGRFNIEKVKDGVYRLQPNDGSINYGFTTGVGLTKGGEGDIFIRLIPMNIDWDIQNIATEYLTPILSPAQNGFGFNNTLINCGQGELSQEIGKTESITSQTSVGWEETVSISSTYEHGGSYTIGLSVEASFFGNGATYSASAEANHNYASTSATDTTNWNESIGSNTTDLWSTRTVTVLPKSASLVYDASQTYDNVKVNLVQRLRVKAREHDTRDMLSGEEISTQFHFNGFDGVITEVGIDYIEITVRGVATMEKIIDWTSEVKDVDPMCDN